MKPKNTASYDRRKFIKQIIITGVTLAALPTILVGKSREIPLVIKNGKWWKKNKWVTQPIGISSEGKIRLDINEFNGIETIDASNHIISPGFIDILTDNGFNPEKTYSIAETYKVTDGVTTALQLHGGASHPGKYYSEFGNKSHLVNYGVGVFVMGIRNQYHQIPERLQSVEKGLLAGALAVCHSLEYQVTDYKELLKYAQLAKKYQRPLVLHLRYSSKEKELDGIIEAIRLVKDSGCQLHIAHLNSTGGMYQMEQALYLIENARKEGLSITTCIYPFTFWATYISSSRFNDGWMKRYNLTYGDLTVVGSGEKLTEKRFYDLRKQTGILVAVPEGSISLDQTILPAMKKDFVMIGSDGGIQSEQKANSHPRGASTFATTLSFHRYHQLSLENLLMKMTTLPSELVGEPLKNRGELCQNYRADITIFHPDKIKGTATVAQPTSFSDGIHTVIVNGKIAVQNKQLFGHYGKEIRWTPL